MDLDEILKNPDSIIGGNEELASYFLEMTESFFAAAKENEFQPGSSGNLEKLLTEGFGQYSIWQQIKLQNDSIISSTKDHIVELMKAEEEEEEKGETKEEEEQEESEGLLHSSSDDEPLPQSSKPKKEREMDSEDDEDAEVNYSDFEFDATNGIQNAKFTEEDLQNEEEEQYEEEEDGLNIGNGDLDNEDYETAVSNIILGNDNDDPHDAAHMTYASFFGDAPPEQIDYESRQNIRAEEDEAENPLSDEKDSENDEELDEKRRQIREIEDKMRKPRDWHLMGETDAMSRPKDGLADVEVEFAMTNSLPPDPLSTEELNKLLISRIESMAFDDVVRKKPPTKNSTQLYALNGVKSTKSLAELYEDDLLNQQSSDPNAAPKLTPEQREAMDMWRSLEHELNKFTERRFMARRPREKIDIAPGSAALDVEARPEQKKTAEEIMAPAGGVKQIKGEAERTHEERKAERRARKEARAREQEKRDAAKGVLFSQSGGDGSEVKIAQDVARLARGELAGIETYTPGQAIPDDPRPKKNVPRNTLL